MNSPEPRSDSPRISYRLAIASTLSAGAALLLAVVLLIIVEFFTLRSTLLDETRVKAAVIADNVSAALVFQDAQATGEIIRTLRASSIVEGAAAIDGDGVTLASYPQDFAIVPVPDGGMTLALLGLGVGGLSFMARRRE